MSIGRRLMGGSVLRLVDFVLQVAIAFVMTPFIVGTLGVQKYGAWVVVGTLVGYYGLLDLGMSSAVTRFLSKAIGSEDRQAYSDTIRTALVVFASIGGSGFVLASVAIYCLPSSIRAIDESLPLILIILVSRLAIGFPIRALNAVLSAGLRHDLQSVASICRLLVGNVLILCLLGGGDGLLTLSVCVVLAWLTEYVLVTVFALWCASYPILSTGRFSRNVLREMASYCGKSFTTQILNMIRFRFDPILVGWLMGARWVTYFAVGRSLLNYFMQLVMNAVGLTKPLFSQYDGRGDRAAIKRQFRRLIRMNVAFVAFVGLSMAIFGEAFMMRWMGDGFRISYVVMLLMLPGYMIALMQTTAVNLMLGVSRHHYLIFNALVDGLVHILLALLLSRSLGLFGVPLAIGVSMVCVFLTMQPYFAAKVSGIPIRDYYMNCLLQPFLRVCAFSTVFWLVFRSLIQPTLPSLILLGALKVLLFSPYCLFVVLNRDEREALGRTAGSFFSSRHSEVTA